jgi:hypothetical protein
VAVCHVKVGNCQALNTQTQGLKTLGFLCPKKTPAAQNRIQ